MEKKDFIIIDAGMNNLVRPAMYNARHEIFPVKRKNFKIKNMILLGQYASLQIYLLKIIQSKSKKDDLVVICSVGAYGACMSSEYNLRGNIKEIFIKKNKIINE